MTAKSNTILHIGLIEVRELNSTPKDFFVGGGPFQVLLELIEINSKNSLWKHKSATVQSAKPPVVFKEKAHATNLPALELEHDSQPNCKLDIVLCKQKGSKWFKDTAAFSLSDLVVNKPEEKVVPMEKGTAAVVIKLHLSNSQIGKDNLKSLSELRNGTAHGTNGSGKLDRANSSNAIGTPYSHSFVNVAFSTNYHTQFGEVVCVCGSIPKLGGWDVTKAPKMNWNEAGRWNLEIAFRKSDTPFEYKYVIFNTHTQNARWESTPNRKFSLEQHPEQHQILRQESWEVV